VEFDVTFVGKGHGERLAYIRYLLDNGIDVRVWAYSWMESWLKSGGILRIEVPNSQRTSSILLNPLASQHSKAVALRHIFGSHEAYWAIHCEGSTIGRLRKLLRNLGFGISKIRKNSWKGTHNFEVIARKNEPDLSKIDMEKRVEEFLSDYLVDSSQSELKLLDVWMNAYKHQVDRCGAK